ncbi:MAG: hypothetical protein ICV87_10185 [Gemmatimonadetes bacterium]|nr:hypothetical protein [Gemmatimonadota bacterium]
MEVLTRFLAAAALLSAAGCSFLRDPTPVEAMGEQPSVHALLMTGSDTVKVLLQRVGAAPRLRGAGAATRPISGADVRLTVGGETVRLAASPAGFSGCVTQSIGSQLPADTAGCYAAVLAGGVKPGAEYALRIGLPGGGTIEGRARALAALRVESPAAGARIHVKARTFDGGQTDFTRLAIRLRGAEGSAGVSADLVPLVVYSRGQPVTDFFCSVDYPRGFVFPRDQEGTITLPVAGVQCVPRTPAGTPPDPQFRTDSVRAVLRAVAYDSAYVRYLDFQEQNSVAAREVTVGVTGAIGLFAAAARAEHEVVLIPFFLEGVAGIDRLNQEDRIHPNAEGTRIVAATVYRHLKPLLEKEARRGDK